ncbi:MAG: hypothetical protein M9887_08115 [Chitinophagales bacterium]|nr:hypothetical protein [Chitinophagales bacterium]
MSAILQIVILFICMNTILKVSFWDTKYTLLLGFSTALFITFIYPYSIEQSQVSVRALLKNQEIKNDIVVLLTIESLVFMGFCFVKYSKIYGHQYRHVVYKMLNTYPGVLIFPVIFYLFMQTIFSVPGLEFRQTAILFAFILIFVIPLSAFVVKKLFKDEDFRLEVLLITNITVIVLGLIFTTDGTLVYKNIMHNAPLTHTLIGVLILISIICMGFFWDKILESFKNR